MGKLNNKLDYKEYDKFLLNILESIADPIFVKDDKFRIILANRAFYRILGMDKRNVLGKTLGESLPKNQMKHFLAVDKSVIDTGKGVTCKELLTGKDGKILTIVTKKTRYTDKSGQNFVVGVIREITKYNEIELKLKQSENKYRLISNQSPLAIELYDKDGKLIEVNPACLKLFGIINANEIKQFSLNDDPNISDKHKKALKLGKATRFETHFDFDLVKQLKLYHSSKSGMIYLDIHVTPTKGLNGAITGYLLIIQDITKRKTLENNLIIQKETITNSEKKYRSLFESIEQGVALHKAIVAKNGEIIDFEYIDTNESFLKMFKLKNNIFGKKLKEVWPNIEPKYFDIYKSVAQTGKAIHYENYFEETNKYYSTFVYRPLKNRFAVNITDITERKQLEEKLLTLALRDSLTGLYSRHYYEEEVLRLKSGRHFPVSVIYIDIDGLNQVNNTLGHAAGDRLIKSVSSALGSDFRIDDSVSRIGGDEFVVLLPDTNEETALRVVDRIRLNLKKHNLKKPKPPLSLSIGFATALKSSELDKIILLADKRMYAEKNEKKQNK